MKSLFIIAIAGIFASCDDRGQHFDHTDVIGNYKMTEWNAPIPVDLDQNGESSRNLFDESSCFENAEMSINADGTFTKIYRSIIVDGQETSCHYEIFSGQWERTSNRLTLSWVSENSTVSDVYNFGSVNEILTRTIENTNYPNIDENGKPLYEIGHVNVVFTKIVD